ncbi:MAG: sialidase family protein [Promethearchaeota archaeon]
MTFFRFTFTLFLISTLIFSIQLVGWEISSEIGNGSVIQNKIEDMNRFSGRLPNDGSFGISTKISEVEGAFAVVATDNIGGVYVAYQSHWAENSNQSESFHIYFVYSHDYGENWSESFRVDDNGSSTVQCDSPSIAIDQNSGHIFVAWKDNRTGVAKVYVDKSVDRGVSFGSDVTVYDWSNDYVPPWLPFTVNIEISDDGTIFVAWLAYNSSNYTDCNICFARSIDDGQTFNTPIIIDSNESEASLAHPWVAIESTNVLYVVYSRRTTTSSDIYLVKSQDGGSSFETPVKVTDTSTQSYCGGAQVVVSSDGKIHVVWTDNRAGAGTQYLDIYYAISTDGGLSFAPNVRVNDDLGVSPPDTHPHFTRGAQGTPSIATDSDSVVHIVWEDFRNFVTDTTYCRDIYYAFSNTGTEFSSNLKINYVPPDVVSVNCADPNIVIDSQDNFFIVYSDAPSGDNDHHYIYFIYGTNVTEQQSSSATEQSSETPTPTFGFRLIPTLIAFLIVILIAQKKRKSKKYRFQYF